MKGKLHVIGFGLAFMFVGFALGHQVSELSQTCPVLCDTPAPICKPCPICVPEIIPQYIEKDVIIQSECYYQDYYNDGFIDGEAKGRMDCNAEWQQYN